MMDLHSFVFKCAHALLKRTMETFFFLLRYNTLPIGTISQLFCVVITEIPRALFSLAGQIISTASTSNAPQPNSFLLPLSLSTAELLVSLGSCFSLVVWQLWLALAAEPARPPSSSRGPHMSASTSMLGSFQEDRWGVTRSQTALNGPNQAVSDK